MQISRRNRTDRAVSPEWTLRFAVPRKSTVAALIFSSVLIATTVATPQEARAQDGPSVPAEFVRYLDPPGPENSFQRPAAIVVDRRHDEVLVADGGNNRILIFDSNGTYKYEFSGAAVLGYPISVDVDSEGYIYVLGSTQSGRRIFRFDFDGAFVGPVEATSGPTIGELDLREIVIDETDTFYLLDHSRHRIYSFDRDGNPIRDFAVADPARSAKQEQVYGSLAVRDGRVYLPVSSMGTVEIYTTEGERIRSVGFKGNTPGQLNFPVSVAVTDDLILVLDRMRFNVVCYGHDGRFRGEFGGKGINPGWFYFPTLLETNGSDQVIVGQIFNNRVQICRIPEFIANPGVGSSLEGELIEEKATDALGIEEFHQYQRTRRVAIGTYDPVSCLTQRPSETRFVELDLEVSHA